MWKKKIAVLMSAAMLISAFPTNAFAGESSATSAEIVALSEEAEETAEVTPDGSGLSGETDDGVEADGGTETGGSAEAQTAGQDTGDASGQEDATSQENGAAEDDNAVEEVVNPEIGTEEDEEEILIKDTEEDSDVGSDIENAESEEILLEEDEDDADGEEDVDEQEDVETETGLADVASVGSSMYGDFRYTVSDGKATITGYTGSDKSITVPAKIGDYTVAEIGAYAFQHSTSLTEVTLLEGLTSIGTLAFYDCTSLTEVTFPEGLISIKYGAFMSCESLIKVALPEGLTNIGDRVFGGCTSLVEVTLPIGLKSIGYWTFGACVSLEKVTLPEGLTSLGSEAFSSCHSLKEVTFPEGLTSIGDRTFWRCDSLTQATFSEGLTSIGYEAFCECTSLKNVILPEGMTSIGFGAFYKCNSLVEIILPKGLTCIDDTTFAGCTSLTKVLIPEGISVIENSAFEACSSLTELTLPEGLKEIWNDAFRSCKNLKSIFIPASVTIIGYSTFKNDENLTDIYYSGSETDWAAIKTLKNGTRYISEFTSKINIHYNSTGFTTDSSCTISVEETNSIAISATNVAVGIVTISCSEDGYSGTASVSSSKPKVFALTSDTTVAFEGESTEFTISGDALSFGTTTITVKLSDGTSYSYDVTVDGSVGILNAWDEKTKTVKIGDYRMPNLSSGFQISESSQVSVDLSASVGEYILYSSMNGTDGKRIITSISSVNSMLVEITKITESQLTVGNTTYPISETLKDVSGFAVGDQVVIILYANEVISIRETSWWEGPLTSWDATTKGVTIAPKGDNSAATYYANSLTDLSFVDKVDVMLNQDVRVLGADGNLLRVTGKSTIKFHEVEEDGISTLDDMEKGENRTIYAEITLGIGVESVSWTWSTSDSEVIEVWKEDDEEENTGSVSGICTEDSKQAAKVELSAKKAGKAQITCKLDDGTEISHTYQVENRFIISEDNWGFKNYDVTDTDLSANLTEKDYNNLMSGLSLTQRAYFQEKFKTASGGVCFGMASTALMVYYGSLSLNNVSLAGMIPEVNNLHAVKIDKSSTSTIAYYYLNQFTDAFIEAKENYSSLTVTEQLDKIEKGSFPAILIFGAKWGGIGSGQKAWGHAVIACDIETSPNGWEGHESYTKRVLLWDPNEIDLQHYLYLNAESGEWIIPQYANYKENGAKSSNSNARLYCFCSSMKVLSDMEIPKNPIRLMVDAYESAINVNCTLAGSKETESYTIEGTDYSVDGKFYVFTDVISGSDASSSADLNIWFKESITDCTVTPTSSGDNLDFSMWFGDHFLEAESASYDSVTFSEDGGVSIQNPGGSYTIEITSNAGSSALSCDTVEISGSSTDSISAQITNDGVLLEGSDLKNVTISGITDSKTTEKVSFNTEEEKVLLSENEGTLEVLKDSNGDGKYETSISGNSKGNTTKSCTHKWSKWKTKKKATVSAPAKQVRTCSKCKKSQTRNYGKKLTPKIKLTASSLTMKTRQSTTAFKAYGFANGDYLKKVTSSNTKILTVSNVKKTGTMKLTAQKKKGKVTLTLTMASGLTKKVTVNVQKKTVKTTAISGVQKSVTLKKGKTITLKPTLSPITSQQKITFKSSNKKVVTVTSKGVVKAVKKGTATITVKSGKKKVKCKITVK